MSVADTLRALLKVHGPMTPDELVELTDLPHSTVRCALANARRRKTKPYIHIVSWRHQPDGKQGDFVAVYGLNSRFVSPQTAARPARYTRQEIDRRFRERNKARIQRLQRRAKPDPIRDIAIELTK